MTDQSDPAIADEEMTPGRAAFETWYASIAGDVPTVDAWRGMGEHQATWDRVATAAILAHEEG